MTPREIFIYLVTALAKDQTIQHLDRDSKTGILEVMRQEFCPKVTDQDWAVISQEIDHDLQPKLTTKLFECIKDKDLVKINKFVLERWEKQGHKLRIN